MKCKIDENLPSEAAQALRLSGHDAVTVIDQSMGGTLDASLASICHTEGRVLVTLDLDFSNIQAYSPSEHSGIIVLQLMNQDKIHVLTAMAAVIPCLSKEPLRGRLWIVDEQRIRIRA